MKIQLYDKSKIEWDHLTFSNMDLRRLIIPLMIEQFLNSLMGMADTMMVSRAGEAAISAVSLVDAVNILITQVFTALATGGTIICAQYIGRQDKKERTDYKESDYCISRKDVPLCSEHTVSYSGYIV